MYKPSFLAAVAILVGLSAAVAPAWWVEGHGTIAEAAALQLPEEMPAFFRGAGKQLAHLAGDPDRWKNPSNRNLRPTEGPDHYLDLEDLEGNELPPTRFEAFVLFARLNKKPDKVGLLPYALMEHYDRLSCAFYDYRHDPDNPAVRAKCIVYAGVLAHYTGDSAMPLHTTRDYDGRKDDAGKLVQKGIHARIDAFPEKQKLPAEAMGRDLQAHRIENVWEHVVKTIRESHRHIDRCYELDRADAFERPTAESRAFILERCRAGVQFTMDMWYSAWTRSADMPRHY